MKCKGREKWGWMEVVKYCTGKVNSLVWKVKLIQKRPCSKAALSAAQPVWGLLSAGTGGCPWLPHPLQPGWEHGLEVLPRIFRSCCWSPHLLLCKETPKVRETCIFFTSTFSHGWRLSPADGEEDTAPPSQYCHLSQLCLALCALSTPQNIPDPIATEQIAHTQISPSLGFEWCAGRLGLSSDSTELPSASPGILGDSVCYCEQVWCVIHSPILLEMV